MRCDQRPNQQTWHQWIAEQQTDGSTGCHAADKVEHANDQGSTAYSVEFLEINLQPDDEQKVNRADVRDELQCFALRSQQIENAGSHEHSSEKQADEIGKTCSSEQRGNQHGQRHQQGEGTEWLMHQMGQ